MSPILQAEPVPLRLDEKGVSGSAKRGFFWNS